MKNILVLDDNKYILDALSASIGRSLKECTVLTATDGKQGGDILRSTPIDLILTDLEMPFGEDGYRFIENARRSHPCVPVYVMSGICPEQMRERLQILGVARVILKPFLLEELMGMIRQDLRTGSESTRQRSA